MYNLFNQTTFKADQNRNRALSIFTDGRTLWHVAAYKSRFAVQKEKTAYPLFAGQICNKEQLSWRLYGAVFQSKRDNPWAPQTLQGIK